MAGFDTYFSKYRSSFGAYAILDSQGPGRISSREIQLQYAYEIPVTDKITVRAGVQLGVVSRRLDYSKLLFPDQYNDNGYIGASQDGTGSYNIFYPDVSSGFVAYSNHFWFGTAVHHMNSPNISIYNDKSSRLPLQCSIVGGYQFLFKTTDSRSYMKKFISLIPTFQYKFQGKSDQLDLGTYLNYDYLVLGVWYRGIEIKRYLPQLQNNESVVAIVGLRSEKFRISYSYDFVVSRLVSGHPRGAHELSLSYVFSKDHRNKKLRKRLPCPKF
jgi:type IX secretion system PorP/SprF family membrane protein